MKDVKDKVAVGVDIGGTKIRACIVNNTGKVLGEGLTIATGGYDEANVIIERIQESILTLLKGNNLQTEDILGIGMGVTGPLDIYNGIILECPQLPTLYHYPLRTKISDTFNIPVHMNNDANALILGESIWGTGKNCHLVLGFTLGTGIGCAYVTDSKIHIGSHELSGEIWPSPYKDATIEDYVSGRGICQIYQKKTGLIRTAFEIAKLGENGDTHALNLWNEFGEALGFAISWSINLIDPDIVVLGGSIANSFHLFSESLNNYLRRYCCPSPSGISPIVKSTLGNDAGAIGAAGLVFTNQ